MGTIDREDIRSSLLKKGFKEKTNDHDFYFFYYQGKKTSIFTKLSRGSSYKTYSNKLVSLVARQMKLTTGELRKFVDCEIQLKDYTKILLKQKLL